MSYYKLQGFVSNSLLNEVVNGKISAPESVLTFGSEFHAMALEGIPSDNVMINKMVAAMYAKFGLDFFFKNTKREHEVYRYKLGVWFKGKLDLIRETEIVDLKTTSASNHKAFSDCVIKYNYDQQAFIYLMLWPKAEQMRFVGIQKNNNPQIFEHIIKRGDIEYLSGMEKCLNALEILMAKNLV